MAIASRPLRCTFSAVASARYVCWRCCHKFSTSAVSWSGHNKWSKIKHDKAVTDGKKNVLRSSLAKEIAQASALYGPDPKSNPSLATVLGHAKKAGIPKAIVDSAIARGQGRQVSASGAPLETLIIEALTTNSVAVVVEVQTDNRNRGMHDVRHILKNHGASIAPTSYLFTRRGRIQLVCGKQRLEVDDVLEDAISAGAEDVEVDDEGDVIVWTAPVDTIQTARELARRLDMVIKSSDIVWDANKDTMVSLQAAEEAEGLKKLSEALHESAEVQAVFFNLSQGQLPDSSWNDLKEVLETK